MTFRWLVLSSILTACTGTGVTNTDASTDASLDPQAQRGMGYVAARGCPRCHGDPSGSLSGQSLPVPGTMAYGRNLTSESMTGISFSDDVMLLTLRVGVDDHGFNLCPTMPRYSDIAMDEVRAINAYLHALSPVRHAVPASTCP